MAAELEMHYVLYVSDKPLETHKSLQEAKAAANKYINDHKLLLMIEHVLNPEPSAAPKTILRYDHELHTWSIHDPLAND